MLTKAQVKHIRSLAEKKCREAEGLFVVEGDKAVREAMNAGADVAELFATADWLKQHGASIPARVPVSELADADLVRISFLQTPQPVLGLFRLPKPETEPLFSFALLLDTVQDPGNVGTIIRIADWFGISHVYLHGACADPFSPKVVQATMGSLFRVKVSYADGLALLNRFTHLPRIAATLHGKPLESYGSCKEGLLVIGNESRGISEDLISRCSVELSISGAGHAESLNAAVATGILCHRLLC